MNITKLNLLNESILNIASSAYDLGDGETMLRVGFERIRDFEAAMASDGWQIKKIYALGETTGTYYEKDGNGVYWYVNKSAKFAKGKPEDFTQAFGHAVIGAKLPVGDDGIGEAIYDDSLFYQFSNNMEGSGGMAYLLRMKDGSFIMIDGGHAIGAEGLLKAMAMLHPKADADKPYEISAWIVTHPHHDHTKILFDVMDNEEALAKLSIRRLIFNVPSANLLATRDTDVMADTQKLRDTAEVLAAKGCDIIKPYAGMSFRLGEFMMRIFYTAAEWATQPFVTVNDSSMVFTLDSPTSKKVMILGDIMSRAGDYILKMYTRIPLHADIVQVAHHALYGPDFPLYETIAPSVCFWPIAPPGYAKYAHVIPRNNKLRRLGIPQYYAAFGDTTITL